MKYIILRTEKADGQLRDLICYIAEDSGSIDTALSYLDKIEHAIMILAEQPYYGVQARQPTLKRMKYRVLVVERHLVFYKVKERDDTVIIYAVLDARRDYENLIF